MFGDLDVVVEVDAAALPLGVFIRGRGQRQQRWPVDLLEQGAAGRAPAAHGPIVQLRGQLADRGVQFAQREKPMMPQSRQDPALHHLHPDLDLRPARGDAASPSGP
jgi:hypothetical protein